MADLSLKIVARRGYFHSVRNFLGLYARKL